MADVDMTPVYAILVFQIIGVVLAIAYKMFRSYARKHDTPGNELVLEVLRMMQGSNAKIIDAESQKLGINPPAFAPSQQLPDPRLDEIIMVADEVVSLLLLPDGKNINAIAPSALPGYDYGQKVFIISSKMREILSLIKA